MAWVKPRQGPRGAGFTACYRDPDGRERSAGTFSSRREALRAANREEQKVLSGSWHDASLGQVTFRAYVEDEWFPNKHLE
ncbi:MAG: site-specific integrase, partial [Actinomycetota bacterium]|nr:site-specific integrase [Actinomycetota bacterium]